MFTLHGTSKLLETLKVKPGPSRAATTRLGNWYATHLAGPRSPVMCVSERTFLPVVVERCPASELPRALADGLATLLLDLGVPKELIEQERFAMAQSSWAKTESRSLVGVLTEQVRMAPYRGEARPQSLAELNRDLANNIVKLQFPIDLTRQAFGLEPPEPMTPRRPPPQKSTEGGLEQLRRDFARRAPVDAHVVGVPVRVVELCEEGNALRGLVAVCELGGERHRVSLADVVFDATQPEARLSEAFRRTLGLEGHEVAAGARRHKASTLALDEPLELVVLAARSSALRCRVLGTRRELTLRTAVRDEVPGEIITVRVTKQWSHAGHPYVSGQIIGSRLEVARLELAPLALRPEGEWDPIEAYWGEEGEPLPKWAVPIVERGPRPVFEMGQVIPGADPDDWESDPILDSSDLREAGRHADALAVLQGLLAQDLRCLDAHAHLGNAAFDRDPELALRHYTVGRALGDQALGAGFDGVLPWGLVDNRPYLRCLHGVGLCHWRLGRRQEAAEVFTRMLWLNPSDNQGARFCLVQLTRGLAWQPDGA